MAKRNNKIKSPAVGVHREVQRSVSPEDFMNAHPSWKFARLDTDGKWGWKKIGKENWETKVFPKLKNFERMKWSEILKGSGDSRSGSKHHKLDVPDAITKEALQRLSDLNLNDVPALFSFGLENKMRVIGIRQGAAIELLWFDPEHEVAKQSRR